MNRACHKVAQPPSNRVLMVYDGECNFCCRWIFRWKLLTGDRVEYVALQDIGERFPEIAEEDFQKAVHLIDTNGEVFTGAEAVFKALESVRGKSWLYGWYRRSPLLARLAEWGYTLVAERRSFFSFLTTMLVGKNVEPPTYFFSSWLFIKSLGLIALIAFISLWVQADGLFGSEGILPLAAFLENAGTFVKDSYPGESLYRHVPTLFWFGSSDSAITIVFVCGTIFALMMIAGVCPALGASGVYLCYLSVMIAGQDFLTFQWDSMLAETAFLTIFFAPWVFLDRLGKRPAPSRLARLLVWWLLFRLMFESGVVKLNHWDYDDVNTWRDLTTMNYHYWTQPIPSWVSWYAHHYLPLWVHRASVVIMFLVEVVLPFFVLGPRRVRNVGCAGMLLFQALIILTGNYGIFNLLAMVLCLSLVDDQSLPCFIRSRLGDVRSEQRRLRLAGWIHQVVLLPTAAVILAISGYQVAASFEGSRPAIGYSETPIRPPEWAQKGFSVAAPFRIVNAYGLFRVMTVTRPEIVIEGSMDGVDWAPYSFKYKAGDTSRKPGIITPHMPRLDWRMWFAALLFESNMRVRPWFVKFMEQLLNGNERVIALLEENPFPDKPPQFLRVQLYSYTFADPQERRKTGAWWHREKLVQYKIEVSLKKR